jgi:hypothetical protein
VRVEARRENVAFFELFVGEGSGGGEGCAHGAVLARPMTRG